VGNTGGMKRPGILQYTGSLPQYHVQYTYQQYVVRYQRVQGEGVKNGEAPSQESIGASDPTSSAVRSLETRKYKEYKIKMQ
jgi:hypothetical protein